MKSITCFIFLLLMGWTSSVYAQDEMLEVQVSRDSVFLGNQVRVSFIANNVSGKFTAPDFKGFDLVSGPNTSSSYSFMNGEESRKTTYTYLLQPLKAGVATIGKAGFETANGTLYTNEIKIFVKENPTGIREDADKNSAKNKITDLFGDFGNMNDFFFGTPDWSDFGFPSTPATPPPPKKTYKFKTEKL